MYIERVVHVKEYSKEEYQKAIEGYKEKFDKADFNYSITESRYNGKNNVYMCEIAYWFDFEEE